MSILPVIPKVIDYNSDKPKSIDCNIVHDLNETDWKKIHEITTDLIKLNPPYSVEVRILEVSKQMYLRCTDKPKPSGKTVSLPSIHKGINKV